MAYEDPRLRAQKKATATKPVFSGPPLAYSFAAGSNVNPMNAAQVAANQRNPGLTNYLNTFGGQTVTVRPNTLASNPNTSVFAQQPGTTATPTYQTPE